MQVKYGLIRLVSQEADLCEQVQNVDMQCPVEKGNMTLVKQVDLPEEIPPVRLPVLYFALRNINMFIIGTIHCLCGCVYQGPGTDHLP